MPLVKLIELTCGTCGVPHAIPEKMYETLKNEGGFWHCPNGHQRGWSEGTIAAELKRARQALAQKDDEIREKAKLVEEMNQLLQAQKRQTASLKKRAANGVCPCCNRTFVQLARHMKTKHPDFTPGNVVPLKKASQ